MSVPAELNRCAAGLLRWLGTGWATCRELARTSPPAVPPPAVPSLASSPGVIDRESWHALRRNAFGECFERREAGERIRHTEGYEASLLATRITTALIWLPRCATSTGAPGRVEAMTRQLLQVGMEALPNRCLPLGCIPALAVQHFGAGDVEVVLYTERADEPGRRATQALASAIAPPLARLLGCDPGPRIMVGVMDTLRAVVRARIDLSSWLGQGIASEDATDGPEIAALDELLHWFGPDAHHPRVAALHNDHIVSASMSAAAVLGIEPRSIATAARSHAQRYGSVEPLSHWWREGHTLAGEVVMPVDLESACRTLTRGQTAHDAAHVRQRAAALLLQVASAGLAASLAYLRLATAARVQRRSQPLPPPAPRAREDRPLRGSRSRAGRRVSESGVHAKLKAGSQPVRSRPR